MPEYMFRAHLELDMEEASKDQWLQARKTGLGGSDALVALGKSPYKSPYVLWGEKVGIFEDEPIVENPQGGMDAAYWGTQLEPQVADEFSKRSGYKIHDIKALFRSQEYPWMLATVDRLVDTPEGLSILECKTRTGHSPLGWLSGNPPDYAVVQLHHYMIALGIDRGFVAVLVGGQSFAYYEIKRDEELSRQIIEAERKLWLQIQSKQPPPIGGTPADTSRINEMFKTVDPDKMVPLPSEAELKLLQYLHTKKEIKRLKQEEETLENQLKAMVGDGEVGLIDNEPAITWKVINKTSVSIKDIEEADPALAKKLAKSSTYRKFNVLSKWKRAAEGE